MASERKSRFKVKYTTEEKQLEFHEKKSQRSNTTPERSNLQYLMPTYAMSALCDVDEESAIVASISNSIRCNTHILMNKSTTIAARHYYEKIVNDQRTTYSDKKLQIYLDLIASTKAALLKTESDKHKLSSQNPTQFELNYKMGTNTEQISHISGCALTVGRYKQTDICLGYEDLTVSRIQCFILIINDSLIILDGWSYFGTKTMQINGNTKNLQHSMPNKRFILRFDKKDTIHLRFGETKKDLIINPKTCIACMDYARTVRNECGHLSLCSQCYKDMIATKTQSVCPMCRAPMHLNLLNNGSKNDMQRSDDMIKSYCKPSYIL